MAIKVDGMKKKPKQTNILFADEKYMGSEPKWDTEKALKYTETEFDHRMRESLKYYNYYFSTKDLKKYVLEWIRGYGIEQKLFDKETVDRYVKVGDQMTPVTVGALIKAHKQGMPLRPNIIKYLTTTIIRVSKTKMEAEVVEEVADIAAQPKVTIQDRLGEILQKHILHFEELEDALIAGKTLEPKAYEYLQSKNVPQAMLGKISAVFEKRQAELLEAQEGKCEQLKEGYAHFKAADFKRHIAFYTKLIADLTSYGQVKKATKKASVRKPPQKEKLVSKLKYLKEEKTLKLVSVNPVDVVGATELWVYNTKTRKLGKYVADATAGTLTVKGTVIVGYDTNKSVQKTLRKPADQLKAFMAAGKIALRKFLEDIKATDTKMNGRINQDTLLLKVS